MWAVLPWTPEFPLIGISAALAIAALAAMAGSTRLRRPPALAVLGALAKVEGRRVVIEVLAAGRGDWKRARGASDPSCWSLSLPEGDRLAPDFVEVLPEGRRTLFLLRYTAKGWKPVPRSQGVPFVLRGPRGSAAVGVARLDDRALKSGHPSTGWWGRA
ncbi:MAG: hypothetical protein QI223_07655 [Candidatus Korarchaeota archaeon]|nr:hypothetical protein [Candidatus Korarchaeota archaeon]